MSGGKETPRQKMIGMMYLVLTALLALNVSKQIVSAFITLNDKLDSSAKIINNKNQDIYFEFDQKRAMLTATGGDMTILNEWSDRADQLNNETALLVNFLLSECNEMIKISEGEDWIEEKDDDGNIIKLKPLHDIAGMDNYDIPTNLFVGGNPQKPIQRGLDIRLRIHEYRDMVCGLMGTYKENSDNWVFEAPSDVVGLQDAFKTANPKDTAKLAQYYKSLTIPEKLEAHEEGELPWPSVIFDHAPIVAAAAMFTSLKLDVKNGESLASEYMLNKVDVPPFKFNKIEPLAFASAGYINQGDSLGLNIMIAAYDSTEVQRIRYGVDGDSLPANWSEVEGTIDLPSNAPGVHKVVGQIGVQERGELVWKDWDFNYTVGQPMGVVAQPKMRILYWGYDNIVEGTASGFDPANVSLSGNGVGLRSTSNGQYIASVSRGTRNATINVTGRNPDGTSVNLGAFDFECRPMPNATLYFGSTENGGAANFNAVRNQTKVSVRYDSSIPLTGVNFQIISGTVSVGGLAGKGKVLSGGVFDDAAKRLIRQSKGQTISILVKYKGPDGITKTTGMTFSVN